MATFILNRVHAEHARGGFRTFAGARTRSRARAARVNFLLILVMALSAVDLALTLHWMQTIGMYESNPLVAYLARATGSPLALSAFKALSVMISAGLLYRLRSHVQAELGAWMAALVLVALCVRWVNYAYWSAQVDPQTIKQLGEDDPRWVQLR